MSAVVDEPIEVTPEVHGRLTVTMAGLASAGMNHVDKEAAKRFLWRVAQAGWDILPKRSVPQHRRLFGLVAAAFEQWPHDTEFKPNDTEHLRAWLLVQAGHFDEDEIDPQGIPVNLAGPLLAAFMRRKGRYGWAFARGGKLYVRTAKTIEFQSLPHKEACKLFDEVGFVVEKIIGIKPDVLLKMRRQNGKQGVENE